MEIISIGAGYSSANSYLLVDRAANEAALVDPGCDAKDIIFAIQSNAVHITAILLTHGHFDHILSLKEIREYTSAPVYIHKLDCACLTNPDLSLMSMVGRADTFDPAEHTVEDGDRIKIGESEICVLHTPGHTAGSVCYLCDAGIISGDTLFYESIGRTDFPGGSFSTIRSSIQRLYETEEDAAVYPGHGGRTSLSHERSFNPFVKMKNKD